jgi:GT2 family glycosyltransferase
MLNYLAYTRVLLMKAGLTVYPKVSVLWLNYNSMHVIDITKKSLNAIASLDYPGFELVVVDNGSSDGSKEAIEEHLKSEAMRKLRVTFVKLSRNLGWTGGVNAAYKARDKRAKYVALTHNDVVPKADYLRTLIEYLESHKDVGAVQGIVNRLGYNSKVDSAGFMLDEALNLYALHENSDFSLTKPVYLSYVEGTMPVYNVEAIRHAVKNNCDLFVSGAFMYYLEDVFISIILWSSGYKSILLPVVTGEHKRMAVSGEHVKSLDLYHYRLRNHIALLYMTNSADKLRVILQNFRRAALSRGSFAFRQMMLRSLIEGIRNGRQLRKKYGVINLYETPMRKTSIKGRLRL